MSPNQEEIDNHTKKDLNNMTMKIHFNDCIRKIAIHNNSLTFDELILITQRIFRVEIKSEDDVSVEYKDCEEDWVSISDDTELTFAINEMYNETHLKLRIYINGKKSTDESFVSRHSIAYELSNIRDGIERILKVMSAPSGLKEGDEKSYERVPPSLGNEVKKEKPVDEQVESLKYYNPDLAKEFDPINEITSVEQIVSDETKNVTGTAPGFALGNQSNKNGYISDTGSTHTSASSSSHFNQQSKVDSSTPAHPPSYSSSIYVANLESSDVMAVAQTPATSVVSSGGPSPLQSVADVAVASSWSPSNGGVSSQAAPYSSLGVSVAPGSHSYRPQPQQTTMNNVYGQQQPLNGSGSSGPQQGAAVYSSFAPTNTVTSSHQQQYRHPQSVQQTAPSAPPPSSYPQSQQHAYASTPASATTINHASRPTHGSTVVVPPMKSGPINVAQQEQTYTEFGGGALTAPPSSKQAFSPTPPTVVGGPLSRASTGYPQQQPQFATPTTANIQLPGVSQSSPVRPPPPSGNTVGVIAPPPGSVAGSGGPTRINPYARPPMMGGVRR